MQAALNSCANITKSIGEFSFFLLHQSISPPDRQKWRFPGLRRTTPWMNFNPGFTRKVAWHIICALHKEKVCRPNQKGKRFPGSGHRLHELSSLRKLEVFHIAFYSNAEPSERGAEPTLPTLHSDFITPLFHRDAVSPDTH